jgi:hypothetical protein
MGVRPNPFVQPSGSRPRDRADVELCRTCRRLPTNDGCSHDRLILRTTVQWVIKTNEMTQLVQHDGLEELLVPNLPNVLSNLRSGTLPSLGALRSCCQRGVWVPQYPLIFFDATPIPLADERIVRMAHEVAILDFQSDATVDDPVRGLL